MYKFAYTFTYSYTILRFHMYVSIYICIRILKFILCPTWKSTIIIEIYQNLSKFIFIICLTKCHIFDFSTGTTHHFVVTCPRVCKPFDLQVQNQEYPCAIYYNDMLRLGFENLHKKNMQTMIYMRMCFHTYTHDINMYIIIYIFIYTHIYI